MADNGSFRHARVASEDDAFASQSLYQQSDLSARLQIIEPIKGAP